MGAPSQCAQIAPSAELRRVGGTLMEKTGRWGCWGLSMANSKNGAGGGTGPVGKPAASAAYPRWFRSTGGAVHHSHGQLLVGPTDLVNFLECPHLTDLSLRAVSRELTEPRTEGVEETAAQRRGLAHERSYRASLEMRGRTVIAIDAGPDRAARVQATTAALATGADAIYQAAFCDDSHGPVAWVGYADFLRRVETPSSLGSYSYEPEDTKLAHHVRPGAVLQLCSYAEQLARLQGRTPSSSTSYSVIIGGSRSGWSSSALTFGPPRLSSNRRWPNERLPTPIPLSTVHSACGGSDATRSGQPTITCPWSPACPRNSADGSLKAPRSRRSLD